MQKRKYNKGFHFTKKNKRIANKGKINKQVNLLVAFNKKKPLEKQVVLIKKQKRIVFPTLKRETEVVAKMSLKRVVLKIRKLKSPEVFSLKNRTNLFEKVKVGIVFNEILKSNVTVANDYSNSSNTSSWDWNVILITIGVFLLLALLIYIIGWPAFFALLGQILLYILIAIIYLVIVIGLIVVSAGLVLLLGDNFMSSIMDGVVDAIF